MENKGKKGEKGCNVSFRSAYQREDSNSGRDAFLFPLCARSKFAGRGRRFTARFTVIRAPIFVRPNSKWRWRR